MTIVLRIIPSMFFSTSAQQTHYWFIAVDFALVVGTIIGYTLLAIIAFRAWDWNSWHGKREPAGET